MGLKEFWHYMITDPKKVQKNRTNRSHKSKSSKNIKNNSDLNNDSPSTIHESTSKKKLSHGVLLFILINSILGSSLFYLPGLGVQSSGPASIIAWILIWMIAAFIMMYIGELLVLHPTSGGTYAFCQLAYGRFIPFIAGWLIWITGNLGMALNVVAAAQYFIPEQTQAAFILQIVFSIIWILVLNFMAFRGIDAGATMLVAFGGFSIGVVLLMVLPSFIDFSQLFHGAFSGSFDPGLLHPFFRFESFGGVTTHLLLSLLFITEAFFGFEAVTYMANEAKDPKTLHKILFKAMAIVGSIVVVYILSSLGTVPLTDYLNNARPFAVQAFNTMGLTGQNFVVFGMYLVIIGASAAWPIAGSRLLQAMAHDKLFPTYFAKKHDKHKSPYRAVLFQTVAIIFFTWIIFRGYLIRWGDPYRTAYLMYIVLSILVLSLVVLAVPVLRRKFPKRERPYKAPFGTIGPIAIVLFYAILLFNWIRFEGIVAKSIVLIAVSLIILGAPLYLLIEMYYNPNAINKANIANSYFTFVTDHFFFAFSMRNKISRLLGNVEGKIILEHGCSVGTLTKKLAKKVGPKGHIYAVDEIIHNITVTEKRTKRVKNITTFNIVKNIFKKPFSKKADILLSVGQLSQMQYPKKELTSVAKQVKRGAKVIFVEYYSFFHLLKNIQWAENVTELESIFKKSGFDVRARFKNGILWKHVILEGKKK